MSTQWKQKVLLTTSTILILFLILIVIFLCLPISRRIETNLNGASNDFNIHIYKNRTNSIWIDAGNQNSTSFIAHEYVRPLKVHNISLNTDDLLYESERNNTYADVFPAYSVTGNYRSKSSQIWDPHPEYTINAFGYHLHLILHQDNSFVAQDTFRVVRIIDNQTEEQDEDDPFLGCYYKGYVEGDEKSAVAVSLCNGMTGHIKTSSESLLIQPVENVSKDDSAIMHKIWRQPSRHKLSDRDIDFGTNSLSPQPHPHPHHEVLMSELSRKKRSYVDPDQHLFTLEVLIAVDRTMSEFHGDDLKSYILTLISIVSSIFSDASIGNSINISVTHLIYLKDEIASIRNRKSTSTSQLLKHFCSFLRDQTYHYDTATILTRDPICRNERETKCDKMLGLAELGTVCKKYSCSIVQDNGLQAAFTIAHELGHIMNMPHDDDSRCSKFKRRDKSSLNIMSSTMGDEIHPWSWSDCSRYYVSEFLEREDVSCLANTEKSFDTLNERLPGEMYTLDQQCQLIHGQHSRFCMMDGECQRLWCKTPTNTTGCRTINLPWADGTPCSNRHWCQRGKCVPRESMRNEEIHGGWGPWSPFSACSMPCGGGVQESQRECNNPLPQNGGKFCSGSRKKYRSCNTQSCPPTAIEPREQQCSERNGNNFGIKGISKSVLWIPKYGLPPQDKCKLYCRVENTSAYFQLAEKVKDGTTCSFDNFDKCVNGICRQAGCDNELNSISKLDRCGVCEGRNDTCEEIVGHFYKSDLTKNDTKTKSVYYYVTTIPKGSSNIEIVQSGYRDHNYIVLRDDNRNSLLNGNRVIDSFKNVFIYAGVTFEYNGSNSTEEKVNTTYSRKIKRDLIVEIIVLNPEGQKEDKKLLTYSYTVDKTDFQNTQEDPRQIERVDIFKWKFDQWSECNSLCNGKSYRTIDCIDTDTSLKVALPFCEASEKPSGELSRDCSTDCNTTLQLVSVSECSASCGMIGTREKNYTCIQNFRNGTSLIVDMLYCHSQRSLEEYNRFEQCVEGCWTYSEWTPCSQSCGTGHQTRNVICILNGEAVHESKCNAKKRNDFRDTVRACNNEPCTDWVSLETSNVLSTSSWRTGEWSECNHNCEMNRSIFCTEHSCPEEKKPIAIKKCCIIKYIAMWSPCSVECGTGTRRKEFYCAKVYKPETKGAKRHRVQIDSVYCRHLKIPTPKRSKKTCKINCKWTVGPWSECPLYCNKEFSTRTVNCSTSNGRQISHRYCEVEKKPSVRQMCSACIQQIYKFSACSCEGFRRKRVICYDRQNKRIPCRNRHNPIRERCQPPNECLPKSCLEVRRTKRFTEDADYTIYVRQNAVKIYCHNMSTTRPKEYITLNSTLNYSVFYVKSTNDTDTCVPSSIHYNSDASKISHKHFGVTNFNKIRINIHSLRVDENDFTFANVIGRPQSFGSAGNCYIRDRNCPQGDFSINLEGTGFYIRSETKWEKYGNYSNIKFVKALEYPYTTVRAFCGGLCGGCSVQKNAGLVLDVRKT